MNSKDLSSSVDAVTRAAMRIKKKEGIFSSLTEVCHKDTMKWILIKFLKESLEFLSTNEEARKTQRGKLVEKWIDENLDLPGEYDT